MPLTVHNVAGEEGGRTAKPLTRGFSTARTCALIHWEDDRVRAAAMGSQGGYRGQKIMKLLYGNASNI